MSAYMWKRDNDGFDHLEDDVLLAYTRGQLPADVVLMVQQHCAKCTRCTQKCAEYAHVGMMLQQNLTYVLPAYPSIVDMLGSTLDNPAAMVTLRQRSGRRGSVQKQRTGYSGSKAVRLLPVVGVLPLIIFVSLLVVAVVVAYTLSNTMHFLPGNFPGGSKSETPNIGSTIPTQPTGTQTPTSARTLITSTPGTIVGTTPNGTTKSAGTSKPVIWICSSNADLAQSRLRICGKNYKVGDKVIILEVLPGTGRRWEVLTTVDAHGTISGAWTISNCRNIPVGVFTFDITRGSATQVIPVNVSLGGCRSPNVKSGGH